MERIWLFLVKCRDSPTGHASQPSVLSHRVSLAHLSAASASGFIYPLGFTGEVAGPQHDPVSNPSTLWWEWSSAETGRTGSRWKDICSSLRCQLNSIVSPGDLSLGVGMLLQLPGRKETVDSRRAHTKAPERSVWNKWAAWGWRFHNRHVDR